MKYLSNTVKGRTCVCVGTRPSFIKMAPIILELEQRGADYKVLHSGQHYSDDLNIYGQLKLREPDHFIKGLDKCTYHGEQTALILREAEKYFQEIKPEKVLVCADANFNLACGLAARKLRLKLGHVESGLRSWDWRTPEEHNRRMLDHISDALFAPTLLNVKNLKNENVQGKIFLTGNTIVEALKLYAPERERTQEFILLTLHREENVDDPEILSDILQGVELIAHQFHEPVIFAMHPRVRQRMMEFGLHVTKIWKHEALPYREFLEYLLRSRIVLTDSGGVQEEACILGVPSVILRNSTDRPETASIGASVVAGTYPEDILVAAQMAEGTWKHPFGEGKIAERILDKMESV